MGRTWKIPTANIMVNQLKLMPPNGVYYTKVTIDEKEYCGITNIGTKPTIGDNYENKIFMYYISLFTKFLLHRTNSVICEIKKSISSNY